MSVVRFAVCNIQSGIGVRRGWFDYLVTLPQRLRPRRTRHLERIGQALRFATVDVAVFTEVDGGSTRTAGVDQAQVLADHGQLSDYAFFPCFSLGGRVLQGNAIHARGPVHHARNHRLSGGGEPRFLSHAVVELQSGAIDVFATHVSLDARVRREQLGEIRDQVARVDGPVLLAGDFNARHGMELDHLSRVLTRVPTGSTFPSWRPRWALDHLFASTHFSIRASRVMHEVRESDHLPVFAELVLR